MDEEGEEFRCHISMELRNDNRVQYTLQASEERSASGCRGGTPPGPQTTVGAARGRGGGVGGGGGLKGIHHWPELPETNQPPPVQGEFSELWDKLGIGEGDVLTFRRDMTAGVVRLSSSRASFHLAGGTVSAAHAPGRRSTAMQSTASLVRGDLGLGWCRGIATTAGVAWALGHDMQAC